MAVVGTQTVKWESGGAYTRGNLFAYDYPSKAVYPGAAGGSLTVAAPATGGGVSVYSR